MGILDRFKSRPHAAAADSARLRTGVPPTSPAADQCPEWMTDGLRVTLIDGNDDLEVVGESFYQDNLWTLVGGRTGRRVRKDTMW